MLEIFAKLKSFSFYHKTEAIYITIEVIDCKLSGSVAPAEKFNTVEPGDTLSLKYIGEKTAEYLNLLDEPALLINTDEFEPSKNPKYNDKFIVKSLRKCDIFKECL